MADWDYTYDVTIVGSGAGGFVGALTAKMHGLEPILIEKRDVLGGSSAMSGGVIWVPNNPLMRREGVADSYEDAMRYFSEVVGEPTAASSLARRHTYITLGSQMVLFLESIGVRLQRCDKYTDYYDERPGGNTRGRCLEGAVWDGRQLGPWLDKLQVGLGSRFGGAVILAAEFSRAGLGLRTAESARTVLRVAARTMLGRVKRQRLLSNGATFIGQMLKAAVDNGVTIWTESPLVDLIEEDGRIAGVVVSHEGRDVAIKARHGVLINAGGFAHNGPMRERYGQDNRGEWSFSNPGDTGEAVQAAIKYGAAVDLMDEAWWTPSMVAPDGELLFAALERSHPCSIMVDSSGKRFCNESSNYMEVGQAMNRREKEGYKANPSWLVVDQKHRSRYALGKAVPRVTPTVWVESGFLKKADTIEELAKQIDVDPVSLRKTIERFNAFAAKGEDPDFHRGERQFDRYWGDPRSAKNPAVEPIDKTPYYAVKIFNGDVGTSGGLLTDENARVLNAEGEPIAGLYASGNSTASVHGRTYPGAGASVGASSIFSYAATLHASAEAKRAAATV